MDALRFGVVANALAEEPRDAARAARAAGFAGVLMAAFSTALRVPDLSATGRREFRHVLSSQDQQLIGLTADLGPKGFGPGADVDRLIAQLDRVMEAAAALASPLVCVDLGALPAAPEQPKPKPKITPQQAGLILIPESATASATEEPPPPAAKPDPAFTAQVDAALLELGRRADRYSVMVAFRTELAGFASLERALRAADCPWYGVDLDPVAVLRDAWSMDEVFSSLGALLRHVRARDAVAGADRRTRAAVVGQGDTDWQGLLANLDSAGYRGWITVDPLELPNRAQAATAALGHLRAI